MATVKVANRGCTAPRRSQSWTAQIVPASASEHDEQRNRAMGARIARPSPARRSAGQCEQALASPALSAVWKLWPQPQVFTALGLLMVKPPPMMAST